VPGPTVGTPESPLGREAQISYRLEIGALLLAIAVSGLLSQLRRRGSRASGGPRGVGRSRLCALVIVGVAGGGLLGGCGSGGPGGGSGVDVTSELARASPGSALGALRTVPVKGRSAKTGYHRASFGRAWADVDTNGCDTRDDILRRDLTEISTRAGTHGCVVITGVLADPYTGKQIRFAKADADEVQIDHVVALSNAWQTGAQAWSSAKRLAFANDPLNLLAVDGATNQKKGAGDAATWLPPRKAFRCVYISRQVAVKVQYQLWVTPAERDAMVRVLHSCPDQALP
jgi:hypothetical protein